jgi:hypothetical protein
LWTLQNYLRVYNMIESLICVGDECLVHPGCGAGVDTLCPRTPCHSHSPSRTFSWIGWAGEL